MTQADRPTRSLPVAVLNALGRRSRLLCDSYFQLCPLSRISLPVPIKASKTPPGTGAAPISIWAPAARAATQGGRPYNWADTPMAISIRCGEPQIMETFVVKSSLRPPLAMLMGRTTGPRDSRKQESIAVDGKSWRAPGLRHIQP